MNLSRILYLFFSVIFLNLFLLERVSAGENHYLPKSSLFEADSITKDSANTGKYKPSKKPTYQEKDQLGSQFDNAKKKRSPLTLDDPKNVKTEVELDESGEYYRVNQKLGKIDYKPASTLTMDEYKKFQKQQLISNYYRQKSKANDDKAAAKKDKPRALVPRIYLNPNLDRIFGGNYIDVKLNGSILLDFGYRIQTTNNPAIPVAQRRLGQFIFDQNIAVNAQAKIGERLKITINQDTKSQFDFDNNVKLEYNSLETDIIQKIEAGNVSMPINSSLIQGSQNLFGVKTTMKFGRLQVTAVAAQSRGRGQEVKLQGGSQGKEFNVRADNYEDNRHYFLSHFFRNNYEKSLQTRPQILSGVNITRVEVWITNRNNSTENLRNMGTFMDLGEYDPYNKNDIFRGRDLPASNFSNSLYETLLGDTSNQRFNSILDATQATFLLEGAPYNLRNGNDFEIIKNARKLRDNEFKFHPQLGYISLNTAVGRDDVVGVSFEYSYKGKTYKVGELQEDYARRTDKQMIILKMLRPSTIRTDVPMWDLQMKNIYSLSATNVSRENFQLRVVYRDDRNQLNLPVLKNEPASVIDGKPLIQVLGLDTLNMSNDPQSDGNFDFIESATASPVQLNNTPTNNPQNNTNTNNPQDNLTNPNTNSVLNQNKILAITIDPAAGRIIFPVLEPFGRSLKNGFGSDTIDRPELIQKYVYNELYRKTKADALQLSNKNKFFIVGRYQATSSDEIPIQGFAGGLIDNRFVKVTSGANTLTENVDYIIQGNGTVKIINSALLLQGNSISVRYEQPDLFQVRSKFFTGTRLDYVLSKDIAFGGTLLNLTERPLVSRVTIGDEPVNNTVWGLDGTFKRDSRFITNALDKLPFYSTKEKSTIQASGEVAQLFSRAPALIDKDGGTFFIDDFESTALPFRLDNSPQINWKIASTPRGFEGVGLTGENVLPLSYRRAKIAWYVIDQTFYRTDNPNGLSIADMQNHYVRAVSPQDLFPGRDRTAIQLNEPIFDIAYYPEERGPYNYNPQLSSLGLLSNPRSNWAGITRAVNNFDTDFDNANYQYLEFWVMDPFINGERGRVIDGRLNTNNNTGGKLIFQLGSVSEDVLKDGRQAFEQGLPNNGAKPGPEVEVSPWGFVTSQPFLVNAFANLPGARQNQDIGLDGLNDSEERQKFPDFINAVNSRVTDENARNSILNDPSNDNFQFYIGNDPDITSKKITERYKRFNNMEGNSPDNSTNTTNISASSYQTPDNEDINQNNTLNDLEEYFQYEIDLRPGGLQVGKNFVVNSVREAQRDANGNRTGEEVDWYLVRIPLREGYTTFGNIQNFKSIRFLRTVLTDWQQPVVLRMAQMQLVASQWRTFTGDLTDKGLKEVIEPNDRVFSVSTVNTEENSQPSTTNPNTSPYVVPPGFVRDRDVNSLTPRRLNEHSLRLCVDGLADGDARAVFKNLGGLNLINFENVKMFVHAEADPAITSNKDLTVFIRFGSDFTDNYYEIESPLVLTNPARTSDVSQIWKAENEFNINLEELVNLKLERDRNTNGDLFSIYPQYIKTDTKRSYIRGNPSYTNIQTIMIGIRNPKSADRSPKSVCIWVNELRVTGIKPSDGVAATAKMNVKLADLGNLSATTKYTSAGFGGLEQKVSQRLQENTLEYGVATNIAMDKLLPANDKIGLKIPVFATYDNKNISPKYDPTNPDVPTDASIENKNEINPGAGNNYKKVIEDNTTRRSISMNNIQKIKVKPGAVKRIYDVENLSLTLGYSDTKRTNVSLADYDSRNYKGGLGYNYAPKPLVVEPFKKSKGILASPYLKLIKDFNITPLPTNLSARGDLDRTITKTQYSNGIINGQHDILGVRENYEKRFLFNRNYALGWSLTKSIQINYTASVNAIVDEPSGAINGAPDIRPGFSRRDSVIQNLEKGGRMKNYTQQLGANYKIPLDKFPATNWLAADARYSTNYSWVAGPFRNPDEVKLGNTNQNSRDITINAKADLIKFYGKIKFLGNINNGAAAPKPAAPTKKDDKDTTKKKAPPADLKGLKGALRLLMMVRSVNATYQRTEGTILPGYLGRPQYFGLDESQNNGNLYQDYLPFLVGNQNTSTFKNEEFANKYLSKNPLLTERITQNQTENITGRANVEPFKDFKIQLDAKLTRSLSFSENFTYNGDSLRPGEFASLNPSRTGNYSISFIAIQTFFEPGMGKDISSPAHLQFEKTRYESVQSLSDRNPNKNYRYDTSSQDALIPAFISAYSGRPLSKSGLSAFPMIPLPNWRIDYAGLPTLFPSLKKLIPSINITHGYSATYNVQNFTSSLRYSGDKVSLQNFGNGNIYPTLGDSAGIYTPINIISQVSIIERFTPLIGINVRTKNNMNFRFEYKTDRTLNLNLVNKQTNELRNEDVTVGYGYTAQNLKLPFKWQGREIVLKNDVTFRIDVTRRESTTILRRFDVDDKITAGQINFNIRPTVGYQINQRLTLNIYADYTYQKPKVSNSFLRTVFAFGIQVRYSLS